MAIKPIGDKILIEAIEEEEVQKVGSLYVPDSAQEKSNQAKVVAVGEGYKDGKDLIPLSVKAGDVVLYSKYAGTELKYEDKDYLIISESDIFAVID